MIIGNIANVHLSKNKDADKIHKRIKNSNPFFLCDMTSATKKIIIANIRGSLRIFPKNAIENGQKVIAKSKANELNRSPLLNRTLHKYIDDSNGSRD